MARKPKIKIAGALYHIITRGKWFKESSALNSRSTERRVADSAFAVFSGAPAPVQL
jgi:hypothetical protein